MNLRIRINFLLFDCTFLRDSELRESEFSNRVLMSDIRAANKNRMHYLVSLLSSAEQDKVLWEMKWRLTKNWAMSKAKSWTKLNRCSANGATIPGQDAGLSGPLEGVWVVEHKVTNTTSQQS